MAALVRHAMVRQAEARLLQTRDPPVRSLSFWRDASAGGVDAARALARRAVAAFHAYVWNENSRALWMPWAMIALKFSAVVAVCLYLSMAAILYFTQRSMMYFRLCPTPARRRSDCRKPKRWN